MIPSVDKQQKSLLLEKIKDILILLRGEFGYSNREIADKVGVGENYLSNVFNGGKAGSAQLLAGLLLLKELTVLKRSGVNQELARELEAMKKRIEEVQQQTSSRYPEHKPQHLAMNERGERTAEPVSSNPADEPDLGAIKKAVAAAQPGKRKLPGK